MKMCRFILFLVLCTVYRVPCTVAQPQPLDYLKTAAENNPGVKAAFHTYEAALQKIPQMGAYQDPQLEMGFFLEPMDLVGGRQIAQFQLMQMFPWFGTRKAARTEAQHMAQMAFEAFREAKDNLYLEVYTQWYALCDLQQKRINSEENKKLLQQLEELALRKYATGNGAGAAPGERKKEKGESNAPSSANSMSGMNMGANYQFSIFNSQLNEGMNMGASSTSGMSEVLRIQLEIIELENNVESILSEIRAGKARFNVLLNRPADSEVLVPDTFSQTGFLPDMASAVSAIQSQNPMLGMLQQEALAYKAQAEMNRKMGYPMFGIGLQYMLMGKSPATNPAGGMDDMDGMDRRNTGSTGNMSGMNGKDMIMPMLSITIPVYRSKYKAAQKESKLLQRANEEKLNDTFNRLQADLFLYQHRLDDAARKITLYKKQTVLTRTTYDLAVQEFASGKSDLSAVIQIQRQLLDYQLKEAEAIAAYNTMVVNVQKIMSSYENKE